MSTKVQPLPHFSKTEQRVYKTLQKAFTLKTLRKLLPGNRLAAFVRFFSKLPKGASTAFRTTRKPVRINPCFNLVRGVYAPYVVFGGRGSLKSSFAALAAYVTANLNRQEVVWLTHNRDCCRYGMEQVLWLLKNYFPCSGYALAHSPYRIVFRATGGSITFVHADERNRLYALSRVSRPGLVVVEDAETVPVEAIQTLTHCFRGRVLFLANPFCSFSCDHRPGGLALGYLIITRPSVRFTYRSVPVPYLGQQFFEQAKELKRLYPDAYRAKYLALPKKTPLFDPLTGNYKRSK